MSIKSVKTDGCAELDEGIVSKIKDKVKGAFKKKEPEKITEITADELYEKMKHMKPLNIINYVADSQKSTPAEYIKNNLVNILKTTASLSKKSVSDFVSDVSNAAKKTNVDATSNKGVSNVDIDERTATFKCIFDGDDGRKLIEINQEMENELRKNAQDAVEFKQEVAQEVEKKGLDVDKGSVMENPLLVKSIMDGNKGNDNEKIEDEIVSTIDKVDDVKDEEESKEDGEKSEDEVDKNGKEETKYKKKEKDSDKKEEKDEKTDKKNDKKETEKEKKSKSKLRQKIDADKKRLERSLKSKFSRDFKKKLSVGIYNTENYKKKTLNSLNFKTITDKLKTKYIVGVTFSYDDGRFDSMLAQQNEEYKINPVSTTETKGIGKIRKVIVDAIEAFFGDKVLNGNVYALRKKWNGKEKTDEYKGNFLYVFVGLDDSYSELNSSTTESLLDEAGVSDAIGNIFAVDGDDLTKITNSDSGNFVQNALNTVATLFGKRAEKINTYADLTHTVEEFSGERSGGNKYFSFYRKFHDKYSDVSVNNVEQTTTEYGDYSSGLWLLPAITTLKILNKEKTNIVNMIGSQVIKFKESRGIIASMEFYADMTKYSLRFSVKNMGWLLTNLDDRKADVDKKFKEDILQSKMVKRFKKYCIDRWNNVFFNDDGTVRVATTAILASPKTVGIKEADVSLMKTLVDKFDEIKKQFQ